jgi:hypothetical protein
VQTAQTGSLHTCTEQADEVQGATPPTGAAPLHHPDNAPDADTELARLAEKFGTEAD